MNRPESRICIEVAHGRVTGCRGTRFGGVCCVPATDGEPARIRVAIRNQTGELTAELREGDTINLPGETWQAAKIELASHMSRLVLIGTSG